jgi:AcrR family transcriptional regulator
VLKSKPEEPGERGSLEGWLRAAYQNLVDSGIDAVRIAPLSERLKLSRTSFYWFFKDRDELLAALLDQWRNKNTRNLIVQADAYADSIAEAILNVFDCWLDPDLFDSRFEFAVRSWAQRSASVATEIKEADAARIAALQNVFGRFGFESLPADVRARTIYLTQIGYISMQTKEDLSTRMTRIPHYVEIFTGQAPQQHELERFFSRHGYVAAKPAQKATKKRTRPR